MEEPQEEEIESLELETRATRRSKIAIHRNVKSGELWFWLLGERWIEESWGNRHRKLRAQEIRNIGTERFANLISAGQTRSAPSLDSFPSVDVS